MRILLVTTAFPPFNSLGAVRVGKLARYLESRGHEVRGLGTNHLALLPTLPVEIDPQKVTLTPSFDINFLPNLLFGGKQKVAKEGFSKAPSGAKRLGDLYRKLLHFPDDQIGWYPYAVPAGKRLIREWRPDLIYATGMPFTALMVASTLGRWSGIPWVGELRDLWADHAFYDFPAWRRKPETWLEHHTLRSAAGLVTVSEPWAEKLREHYSQPVAVVMNGYDLKDYPSVEELDPPEPGILRIVYTGTVYPNQDPTPLFQALAKLGWTRQQVQIDFYARYMDAVMACAERQNVAQLIQPHGLVAYREALRAQMEADLNLLLFWNDPREKGWINAKLFEYLGARRPILGIGLGLDVASGMIRERQAGFVSNNPDAITAQLQCWLDQKIRLGRIPDVPEEARAGLSRDDQYRKLEQFLLDLPPLKKI